MDNRGLSPVIEKLLAAGLVALLVAGGLGALFGGAVPDYRSSAGQELGDRVLATAAGEIQRAVPASQGTVSMERHRGLPGTIRDQGYTLTLDNRTLRLRHPDPAIGGSTALAIPSTVRVQNASVDGGPVVVRVEGRAGNRTLTIARSEP